MSSCMAYQNCLLLGLQVSTTGSSCWLVWWWVLVKCKMRDAATQNWRRNEHAKRWIFCEMETVAKCSTTEGSTFTSVYVCAIAFVVPQLTATAVATHPRHHISERWHVADIKNFTGDDQATLTVDRNSVIYFVYIYEIATNTPAAALRLMAAFEDRSNGM